MNSFWKAFEKQAAARKPKEQPPKEPREPSYRGQTARLAVGGLAGNVLGHAHDSGKAVNDAAKKYRVTLEKKRGKVVATSKVRGNASRFKKIYDAEMKSGFLGKRKGALVGTAIGGLGWTALRKLKHMDQKADYNKKKRDYEARHPKKEKKPKATAVQLTLPGAT